MINPKSIKKGDILYESEYGTTVEIEVLETPIINRKENRWSFPGRTAKRGIVEFAGEIRGGAYNPDLYVDLGWSREFCGGLSGYEMLMPLHTVGDGDG